MPQISRPAMADYGVPTEVEGALPWAWAAQRLRETRNYWVATVDPRGRPHATPVWGVWDDERERFWFSCSQRSLKARNLASNPRVVVACDDSVEVVSLEGSARRVLDGDREIATRYAAKYEPDPVKAAAMVEFVLSHAMFEVAPRKAIGIIEREEEFAARATRWTW